MSWGVLGLFQVADGFILALKNFCEDGEPAFWWMNSNQRRSSKIILFFPQKEVVPFTVKMDVVETLPPPPVSVVVVSSSSNPNKAQLTKARLNRMIRIDLRYILISLCEFKSKSRSVHYAVSTRLLKSSRRI